MYARARTRYCNISYETTYGTTHTLPFHHFSQIPHRLDNSNPFWMEALNITFYLNFYLTYKLSLQNSQILIELLVKVECTVKKVLILWKDIIHKYILLPMAYMCLQDHIYLFSGHNMDIALMKSKKPFSFFRSSKIWIFHIHIQNLAVL